MGWVGLLVLGHPFTESGALPLPPVVLAVVAGGAALAAASIGRAPTPTSSCEPRAWDGLLAPHGVALRTAAVLLLGLLLVASRVGPAATVNLAPIGMVVVGWPVMVLVCLALGPVWRHLDPFDGLARALRAPPGEVGGEARVWAAAPVALVLAGLAVVMGTRAHPATLGTAATLYLVVTLAGCLALGRRPWLERVEPIGLVLTWTGYQRAGRLVAWQPPAGADAVLGAVAGVLLFGLLRRTDVWSPAVFRLGPRPADVVGVLLLGTITAAFLIGLERLVARAGHPGATVAAAVPLVGALTVVMWLAGGRLLIGARLVPHLLVDPFGRGWTMLGLGGVSAARSPIPPEAVVWLQLAILVGCGVLAGRIARARTGSRTAGTAGAVGAGVLLVAGIVLASTH